MSVSIGDDLCVGSSLATVLTFLGAEWTSEMPMRGGKSEERQLLLLSKR